MKLETDPKVVKQLTEEREEENWDFRSFLKTMDIRSEEMDSVVHRINEEVTIQIDCTKCANCCRLMQPLLKSSDVTRLALGLDSSEKALVERYLVRSEEKGMFEFNESPCPMLVDNRCSVYEYRPDDCRSYPHLQKDEFRTRTIGIIQNCSVCPIVFNVVERLKYEFWDEVEALD